jgi:hypothetical protein
MVVRKFQSVHPQEKFFFLISTVNIHEKVLFRHAGTVFCFATVTPRSFRASPSVHVQFGTRILDEPRAGGQFLWLLWLGAILDVGGQQQFLLFSPSNFGLRFALSRATQNQLFSLEDCPLKMEMENGKQSYSKNSLQFIALTFLEKYEFTEKHI